MKSTTTTTTTLVRPSYSFACSGWLMSYHFGVAKCLQELQLEHKNPMYLGSSGGSLAATGLALGCDFDVIHQHVRDHYIQPTHQQWLGAFQVRTYLQETVRLHGNTHRFNQANRSDNLTVVYTSLPSCRSRRVTRFTTAQQLQHVLTASCTATPIAGLPFRLENESNQTKDWCFDGGLSEFQPVLNQQTVTISPLYFSAADIRPSRYVPLWWMCYPPSAANYDWTFDLGYHDAMVWAQKQGLLTDRKKKKKMPIKEVEWKGTFGRFMGYRSVENQLLDALFVALLVVLWKPLAFTLMYFELCMRAVIAGGKACLFGAACKLMVSCFVGGAVASFSLVALNAILLTVLFSGLMALILLCNLYGGRHNRAIASGEWTTFTSCLRNMASLSLILRTVPVWGSSIPIKRHEFLMKYSLVYRVTNHFV